MNTSKTKSRQDIVDLYRREVSTEPVELIVIAQWAIAHNLWQPHYRSPEEILASELGQALREQYFTDPQGRRVRRKHARKIEEILSDGSPKQRVFWDDIVTAAPDYMQASLQQRRRLIVADCQQLKTDVDSYNENYNPTGVLVQTSFDFTEDMAESELPTEYPDYEEPSS
ncbi:MAG TPA: hypothetical protein VFC28_01400 [Opitutaceae bacterium]|nr:hypothetical protein [Opitutaceae bacterium]